MVPSKIIGVSLIMLGGCSILPPTEHPAPNATLNRWQVSCSNTKIERSLLTRNLQLIDQSKLEEDAVVREKVGIINQKILDSDDLCGPKRFR
jgi:hypothetical protein